MNYLVIGGAGFIGSHVTRRLIKEEYDAQVYIYDNFSSGHESHLQEILNNNRFHMVKGDIKDLDFLTETMRGMDVVYSLASNPDIAKAVTQPDIDFWEGTYLINNVLEAMRRSETRKLLYASGSGVYGDVGYTVTDEDFSPMLPTSTYGASKLACEALICSYCHMFDIDASAFRFANVVGQNQTHGVGYDFIEKLRKNPERLEILGDGTQSKSYIYVEDVIDALRIVEKQYLKGYSYYNVATLDYITVTEIANMVTKIMQLKNVEYHYTGGDRGWKGDIPIVRLDSQKIRKTGWRNESTSYQAMEKAIISMLQMK